jgi:hypothetical protein
MFRLDVTVQVWPAQTCHIAVFVWAIVSQQQHCVFENLVVLILDTEVFVRPSEVFLLEILISPHWIICEDYEV